MGKLIFNESKTLKLTNALLYKVDLEEEDAIQTLTLTVDKMQNYIKVKGNRQIGPLIQYNKLSKTEDNKMELNMFFILQCESYIHDVQSPFRMESVIRVPNCMYCRYSGPENSIKFAYDKIQLTAFENDIPLVGESYTVFVNSDEENELIVADVFMERADG